MNIFGWEFGLTELMYFSAWLIATGLIAYLYKKYTDLAKQFVEEKQAILTPLIKLLEGILPSVPDEQKAIVAEVLSMLKTLKSINDALSGISPTKWYSKWKEFKAKIA
jgi:hypothetical protein